MRLCNRLASGNVESEKERGQVAEIAGGLSDPWMPWTVLASTLQTTGPKVPWLDGVGGCFLYELRGI